QGDSMSASHGGSTSGPANGGIPSGTPFEVTCSLIERLLGLTATHRESERGLYIDRGLYVIKQGSSYVMIAVLRTGPTGDHILVRVTAQVVAGVRAEAA